jgi:hypothetical protein
MIKKLDKLFGDIQASFYSAKEITITLKLSKEDIRVISDEIIKSFEEGFIPINSDNKFVEMPARITSFQTPQGILKLEEYGEQIPEIPKAPLPLPF